PRTVVRGRQVEDATPADALANILEGLGVSYALRLDATGAKVETLLILGAAGGAVGTSSVGTTASTAMPVTPPGLPPTPVRAPPRPRGRRAMRSSAGGRGEKRPPPSGRAGRREPPPRWGPREPPPARPIFPG